MTPQSTNRHHWQYLNPRRGNFTTFRELINKNFSSEISVGRIWRTDGQRVESRHPFGRAKSQETKPVQLTLKQDWLRPRVPLSSDEARALVAGFVADYNNVRLRLAIGYVTHVCRQVGWGECIWGASDAKLPAAA